MAAYFFVQYACRAAYSFLHILHIFEFKFYNDGVPQQNLGVDAWELSGFFPADAEGRGNFQRA